MNRLAGKPSAYLRQHAHNPVNWQPFDDAAFADAVARDVPIFLSVGYAACHWCHVMAGESFEDPAIGAYLNQHFVSIKVDREERPDVDDAYMAATQALSGQGGWPMSVFLTPAGKAFYAGTYFAPEPRSGQPSFRQVLAAVQEAWTERRDLVEETASDLAASLSQPLWQVRATAMSPAVDLGTEHESERGAAPGSEWAAAAELAVSAMAQAEDTVHGGFGQAPKFPPTPALEFLMRHAASASPSAHLAYGMAGRTLGAMVRSAVFDRLGGGFARYSVSADWSDPHYEKMLYDNAGLLQALVHWIRLAGSGAPDAGRDAGQVEGSVPPNVPPDVPSSVAPLGVAEAQDAVRATVSWLMEEMRLPGGAFASSLDADTVIAGLHHEGASYRWTRAELDTAAATAALDSELAAEVAAMLGVAPVGSHPLHAGRALTDAEQAAFDQLKPALLAARAGRVMPARDDKVVASWNAMLMAALAEAAMVLEEPAWLRAAVELGEYLAQVHWDGQLSRVSHDGHARGIKGLLEDYAACANGYLTLYAATGDTRWFDFAGELVGAAERDFIADGVVLNRAESGGPRAEESEAGESAGGVPASGGSVAGLQGSRFADPFDNATAAGVALLAQAFTSWAAYTGSAHHRELAESMVAGVPELARRAPRSAGGLLSVVEALAAGPVELAVVGPAGTDRAALVRTAWESAVPGMVIAVWDGGGEAPVPLLLGRGGAHTPLAFVCRNFSCALPVSTPGELLALLT